ncbi:hypothetical protein [Streptomyces sp. NPDC093269]|uniref:hypothetical protein n=1 Tax=Streptomyces sp. NPDC093269 TaxID=3366038 RepID=UPI00380808A1
MSWGEGSMTWSELRDLVMALPEDSATKAAAAGDKDGFRWSQQTYMLATTVNLLQLIAQTLWKANLKGDPPEMKAVEPPRLQADEERDALTEARAARNRALLDSLAPRQAPEDAARKKAETDLWLARIRELEAARAAQPQR